MRLAVAEVGVRAEKTISKEINVKKEDTPFITFKKHHIYRINQGDLVIVHRNTFDKKHLVKR